MSPSVKISENIYQQLSKIGNGLFSEDEIADRMLHRALSETKQLINTNNSNEFKDVVRVSNQGILSNRLPRQRGVTVTIGNKRLHAGTVPDLYEKALRYIVDSGRSEELKNLAPYRTSNQRYLISLEPIHPQGNPFFVQVEVDGVYMEAHKNYATALKQLEELLRRLKIDFSYE